MGHIPRSRAAARSNSCLSEIKCLTVQDLSPPILHPSNHRTNTKDERPDEVCQRALHPPLRRHLFPRFPATTEPRRIRMRKRLIRNLLSQKLAKWLPTIVNRPLEQSVRRHHTADHVAMFCHHQLAYHQLSATSTSSGVRTSPETRKEGMAKKETHLDKSTFHSS